MNGLWYPADLMRLRRSIWGVLWVIAGGGASGEPVEWRWSHPEPHGNNISDMVFRAGVYAHVTDHGGIYTSTNRLSWDRQASGTLQDLRAAAALGPRLLIAGEEGTVLWSDDWVRFEAGSVTPSTADWFEGIAAGPTVAVAVGDNGSVYRSEDGKAWVQVARGQFSQWLTGVAFGDSQFVLAGEGGLIATSRDGGTWTQQKSGSTVDLQRVVFGDGRFVVVGKRGLVLTSNNGVNWALEPASGNTNDLATASASTGERMVAGASTLALRRPPFAWQDQLSVSNSPSPAPSWSYAASVWDGTRYLVGGRTGVLVESFRTNATGFEGATFWFRTEETPRNGLWDLAWIAGTYLAVGDRGTILSSPSGSNWALEAVPEEAVEEELFGVAGSETVGLAVGSHGLILRSSASYTNVVAQREVVVAGATYSVPLTNRVSLMGLEWQSVLPRSTTNTLQGIAWNGKRCVVTGAAGTILTSNDTTNWVRVEASGREFLSSVAYGNGLWVACGAKGALYSSTDGGEWTRRTSGTSGWVYRVDHVNGEWLAVGEQGLVLTSTNGTQWTSRSSGTSSWLTGIRAFGDIVYVVGTQGTVLRSTNRTDWSPVDSLTGKALYGVAGRAGQLIVAGAEGVILRSMAEPLLAPVSIVGYRHFRDPAPGAEVLTVQGSPEQMVRWEGAESLGLWQSEGDFELDLDGTMVVGRSRLGDSRFHRMRTPP